MDIRLNEFRRANLKRSAEVFFPIDSWTPAQYACALAGEVGEACNLIKKQFRGDEISTKEIADELADVLVYLDLLAARLDIDLVEALISKFNEVSARRDSLIFITTS